MNDQKKTKAELIKELKKLRVENKHLQKAGSIISNKNEKTENSENYFESLFENAPLAYQSLDENGYILEVNKAWRETFGYEKGEVIEKNISEFVHPDFQEHLQINFPKFKKLGQVVGVEFEMIKKDGSVIIVSVNGKIGYHPDHSFKQTHCILHDITKRKSMEKLLCNSEEFNRTVIENSPLGISVRDSKGKLLSVNASWKKIWGISEKTINEYMSAQSVKLVFDEKDSYLREWIPQIKEIYKNGGTLIIPELLLEKHRSNEPRWISHIFYAIKDFNDLVDRVVILTEDITKRKLAEKKLSKSQELYQSLVENIDLGIALIDSNYNILKTNQALCTLFDKPVDEFNGKKCYKEFEKSDSVCAHCPGAKAMKTCKTEEVQSQGIRDDGTKFDVRIKAFPIFDDNNKSNGFIEVVEDITTRKKEKQDLRTMHDFNNSIIKSLPGLFYIFEQNSARFLKRNDNWSKITGYSNEELDSITALDFFTKGSDQDKCAQKMQEVYDTGYSTMENNLLTKNGEKIPYFFTGRRVIIDDKTYLAGMGIDIAEQKRAEKEIEKFKTISDKANYGTVIVSLDGEIIYFNECWAEMHGLTIEESIGKHLSIFHTSEQLTDVSKINKDLIKNGSYPATEVWHKRKDGSVFPTSMNGSVLYDENNTPLYIAASAIDITEQKQSEEALKESEHKFKTLYSTMNEGLCLHEVIYDKQNRPIDYKITDINPAYEKIVGVKKEDAIGKLASKLYGSDEPPYLERFSKVAETGQSDYLEIYFQPMKKHFAISIFSPVKGKFATVFSNITERKIAEEEIGKLAKIVKHSSELVNMSDLEGNMTFLNEAGRKILGINQDDVQNKNIMEVIPQSWTKLVNEELLPTLMSKGQWKGDLQYKNLKTGELTDVHATTFTVNDPSTGKPQFLANVSLDNTETKRLQQQESRAQRLESAGRVAGQIAHDFNNLLAPLVAYPDFIRDALPENHRTLKYINDMEKSANKIAEINQQLLTLARRGHYNQEILNLNEVIQFAIGELGILPQTIVIDTDFAKNLMNIKGGGSQIGRVLSNLIHNARDSMQDVGNIVIKTENYYADDLKVNYAQIPKGEYIKVTISDIGCGIPEDVRLNIFDPFFTTKSSDRRRGSGLGLSVVDAVMKDHEGFVDLQSTIGEGTSFYLYFPITREINESATEDEIIGGNESVLVIDDDKAQCEVALRILEKLGYKATAVNSGENAVGFIKKYPQDLLLIDMIMPDGIDGTETFRQILDIYPNQKAIIVSGFAESSRVEESRKLGIELYIRKPLTMKLLASCIRKVLDKKEVALDSL